MALLKASSMLTKNKKSSNLAPVSESDASGTDSSDTDGQEIFEINRQELQSIALDALSQKVQILEDRLKVFQDMVMDDSAYQSDVSDLKSWLTNMENRPDPLADLEITSSDKDIASKSPPTEVAAKSSSHTPPTQKKSEKSVKSPKKTEKKKEEEGEKKETKATRSEESLQRNMNFELDIMNVFTQPPTTEGDTEDQQQPTDVQMTGYIAGAELATTNNKIKTLAVVLNDQLHSMRDKIFTLDHDLKRMARGVEFALLRAKVAGMNDLVSVNLLMLSLLSRLCFFPE